MFNSIIELAPEMPDYLIPAWVAFIQYAISDEAIVNQYYTDTGDFYVAPTNVIDTLIDQATGRDKQFLESFITWVNKRLWGEITSGFS